MTEKEIMDELIYRSYGYNRLRPPDISLEQWGLIFPRWDAYEARLKEEGITPQTVLTFCPTEVE